MVNKPVVFYRGPVEFTSAGRALCFPINHQNHAEGQCVSNTKMVLTSPVLWHSHLTGVFETENTIYKPYQELEKMLDDPVVAAVG